MFSFYVSCNFPLNSKSNILWKKIHRALKYYLYFEEKLKKNYLHFYVLYWFATNHLPWNENVDINIDPKSFQWKVCTLLLSGWSNDKKIWKSCENLLLNY